MSFRLFIYYCAICGGCAAFVGWVLGLAVPLQNRIAKAGIQGMFLGMMVAFGLGLVDSLWNASDRNLGSRPGPGVRGGDGRLPGWAAGRHHRRGVLRPDPAVDLAGFRLDDHRLADRRLAGHVRSAGVHDAANGLARRLS